MAIKNRQGKAQDFVPTKLLGGEFAVVQEGDESSADGSALYLATKTGSVKRIPFAGEVDDLKTKVDEVVEDAREAIASAIDPTLTQSGKAADAKATGDAIRTGAISDDVKNALLKCFAHVAWADPSGQTYYDALERALYAEKTPDSISAVFSQKENIVYSSDSLDSLRSHLTVYAYYSTTSTVVTNYSLSGTLAVGVSTITVTYRGLTTTVNIKVVSTAVEALRAWDFTKSDTDTISGATITTNLDNTSSPEGIVFATGYKYVGLGAVFARNRTYEIDVRSIGSRYDGAKTDYRRIFTFGNNGTDTTVNSAAFLFADNANRKGWWFYLGSGWDSAAILSGSDNYSYFDNKTVKIYIDSDGYAHVYRKNMGESDANYESVGTSRSILNNYPNGSVYIGSSGNDALANACVVGFRAFGGEK